MKKKSQKKEKGPPDQYCHGAWGSHWHCGTSHGIPRAQHARPHTRARTPGSHTRRTTTQRPQQHCCPCMQPSGTMSEAWSPRPPFLFHCVVISTNVCADRPHSSLFVGHPHRHLPYLSNFWWEHSCDFLINCCLFDPSPEPPLPWHCLSRWQHTNDTPQMRSKSPSFDTGSGWFSCRVS